jgi:hypothetical protein
MEFKELNAESLERAANMLKAIAHPLRISIVGCLEDGKKKTVTEFISSWELSNQQHHIIWEYLKTVVCWLQKEKGKIHGISLNTKT